MQTDKFWRFKMTGCKMFKNDCLAKGFEQSFYSHFALFHCLQSSESPNGYPLGAGETV
jgi:hypothetical protein